MADCSTTGSVFVVNLILEYSRLGSDEMLTTLSEIVMQSSLHHEPLSWDLPSWNGKVIRVIINVRNLA